MLPDEPNDEERQEQLAEDNETPFRPADPELDDTVRNEGGGAVRQQLNDTHPITDTDIQAEDEYENGRPEAAGATEQGVGSDVIGYKGVPNPMVDDTADVDAPEERISSDAEDDNVNMEEV